MMQIICLVLALYPCYSFAFSQYPLPTRLTTRYTRKFAMGSISSDKIFENQSLKVLKNALGVFAIISSLSNVPALAVSYGNNYEVVRPSDAIVNSETVNSEDVKVGKEGLNNLIKIIGDIRSDLSKDSQVDLTERIKKDLSVSKIRDSLNKFNSAFSEDTQRGSDRLIRNIIQDVTELERQSIVKTGKSRSANRVATTQRTLSAAESSLKELAAFLP